MAENVLIKRWKGKMLDACKSGETKIVQLLLELCNSEESGLENVEKCFICLENRYLWFSCPPSQAGRSQTGKLRPANSGPSHFRPGHPNSGQCQFRPVPTQARPSQFRPVPIQACPNSGPAIPIQAGAISGQITSGPSEFRPILLQAK